MEDDVYILGLNLSDSELVIWYILTLRNELIRQGIYKQGSKPINKIVYYEAYVKGSNEKQDLVEANKVEANKEYYGNLHIEYKAERLNSNQLYSEFYKRKLDEILSDVEGNKK